MSSSDLPLHSAVIDAGSSGTRIFLYRVQPGLYPVVEALSECEFATTPSGAREDGINNFVQSGDPVVMRHVLPEVIRPLLIYLAAQLNRIQIEPRQVAVHLLATAGMRYAEQQHGRAAVQCLYDLIADDIAAHGFAVGELRTTEGSREEGLWTWVNLNDRVVDAFRTDAAPVGVIEIGGSSAQFSHPVTPERAGDADVHKVQINGRRFDVFCRTWLGLGQDDARKAMRQRAGAQASAVCFPTGFPAQDDAGDVLDGVATFRLGADGAYDFHRCSDLYDTIIDELLSTADCPELDYAGDFVGIEGAYYAARHWAIAHDPVRLAAEILRHCHDLDHFEGAAANEHLQFQAANATYVNALLFGRYGLFRQRPGKFVRAVASKEDGRTLLSWTRGFLLLKYAEVTA